MFFNDIEKYVSSNVCNVISLKNGKWNFETEEIYNDFLMKLSNELYNGETHYFAERVKGLKTPLHFDFDFLFMYERDFSRKINFEFIEGLIERIYTILDMVIEDINVNQKSYIFMKDNFKRKDNDIKDGIHIMFPDIICSPDYVKDIRNKFLDKYSSYLISLNGLSELDPKKIFDQATISNAWLLFHNNKKDDSRYYKIKYILDKHLIEYSIDEYTMPSYENIKKFSLLFKEHLECEYKYKLENIASSSMNVNNTNMFHRRNINTNTLLYPFVNIEFIKRLLYIYNDDRYNDYNKWTQVIWGVRNTGIQYNFLDEDIINLLIDWSKQSNKYKNGDVEKIYNSAREEGILMGSLIMWGKEDNYNDTIKLIDEYNINEIKKLVEKMKPSHLDVATVLSCYLKDEYVYSGRKHDAKYFYKFSLNRWIECDDIEMKLLINKLLFPPLDMIQKENNRLYYEASNNNEIIAQHYSKIDINISNLNRNLGNNTFKNAVVEQLKEKLYNETFYNIIDKNPMLIGLNNGVYNLETNEFRNCNPDDYITMSMKSKYNDIYKNIDIFFNKSFKDVKLNIDKTKCLDLIDTPKEYIKYLDTIELDFDTYEEEQCYEELKHLFVFFSQLFVNNNEREYVLRVLASFLEGRNHFQKFYIGYGCGSNGKSILTKLLQYTFGDYYVSLDVKVLTNARSKPGSATPEFICLRNKRIAVVTEPSQGDILNEGLLKQLTGNDNIQARGLYSRHMEEFTLMCDLFMTANTLPELKSTDGGVDRRLSLMSFDSYFTYNPDPTIPTEFLRDDNLEQELQNLIDGLLYILLHYYNKLMYEENGRLHCPDKFEKEKKKYISEQDILTEFLDRYLIPSHNDKVNLQDIYKGFKNYKKNYNNESHYSIKLKELESLMMNTHTKYKHRKYVKEQNMHYLLDYKLELVL
jgi:P4 family phage/plasmid primase-like protien